MTPDEIEYIREWAASGNEPRFAVDVEGVLSDELWKMLDMDEDTLCELSPLGLTIAAQAERIRELEAFRFDVARETGVMHEADGHAPQPGPYESILEHVALGMAARGREAEFAHEKHVASERIRELETENADFKAAFEQACEVAEECQGYVPTHPLFGRDIEDALSTLRANRERLLK